MPFATDKNKDARITKRDTREGRSGIESLGFAHGGLYSEEIVQIPGDLTVTGTTGAEDGKIGAKHLIRRFGPVFGNTVVSGQTAWDALTATQKATALRLDDDVAPIGSFVDTLTFTIGTGVVTGAKSWLKTAANTWTDLTA